jgi:hypothetical protein
MKLQSGEGKAESCSWPLRACARSLPDFRRMGAGRPASSYTSSCRKSLNVETIIESRLLGDAIL